MGIGRVGSRVAPARVPSRRAPARRRGPRGPTHPSRSSRPPLNAVPQAPTLSSRVGHHSPNRHSRSELIDRAVLRRGFLPRGLCDTCPQVVATRSSERITGRCPTTLNCCGHSWPRPELTVSATLLSFRRRHPVVTRDQLVSVTPATASVWRQLELPTRRSSTCHRRCPVSRRLLHS